MKKFATIEIFIGALTFAGAFLVGEQATSALILTLSLPLTSRKINPHEIGNYGLFKFGNLFFASSIFGILLFYSIGKNEEQILTPIITGLLLIIKGGFDLFVIRKKPA